MGPNYYVTPSPRASGPSRKIIYIGGGLAIAVVVAIVLLLSRGGNNLSSQLQHLSLRIDGLQALLDDSKTTNNLKNEELRQITTELSLSLQTNTNQLQPQLLANGLPEKKFDSAIVANEADTSTASKLEDAFLNNRLDQAYADVLSQKITSLQALVKEVYGQTKAAKLRQALSALYKNLSQTNQRLEKLSL